MRNDNEEMVALAKQHGATTRAGRISFPSGDALASFAEAWVKGAPHRVWEAAVAAVDDAGTLPIPDAKRGTFFWGYDWPSRVEAYARYHGVTRAEVFRRIEASTGANINSMSLRYQQAKP